ncbi:MAG: EAL domain-containing protein [Sphingobacteriia bacterium]|nr:EAL domain-containing protein [Sphingobacteriia bacterium]
MDKNLLPKDFNLITDFYSSRILEIITNALDDKNNNELGFLIVEIKNFNNILFLLGNEKAYSLIHKLGYEIQKNHVQVEIINHNHFLIIIKDCSDAKLSECALDFFNQIHLFGFKQNEEAYFHPVIGGTLRSGSNLPNAKDILNQCITALDNAKDSTQNYTSYKEVLNIQAKIKNEMHLANFAHKALFYKNIAFAFQPIIKSSDGTTSFYESLLRLLNDEGKPISAGPFIPIAEKFGFINLIDDISFKMVIDNLTKYKDITLSFNLSSICIDNNNFLQKMFEFLRNCPELASRLIIEITETAILKDLGKAAYLIAKLQDLGCKVALDDFGSGYTSFKNIKALTIDIIKIDGSFIKDISDSHDNKIFVETFIAMCKKFGLESVAEYVETGDIAKTLIDLKVDYLQGNYFSPAVIEKPWLNEQKKII